MFSVQNPTAVPWDLVDATRALSGTSHILGILPPNPGPDADPVQAAGNRFTVAAGATLTLAVRITSGGPGHLELALLAGPGSTQSPVANAGLRLPVSDCSWAEAMDGQGQVRPMNRFSIRPNGSFVFLGHATLPSTSGPQVATYSTGDAPPSGNDAQPAPDCAPPSVSFPLTVANLSRTFWFLTAGTREVPAPGARLRTWNAQGQARETAIPKRTTAGGGKGKAQLRFDIPPQCELLVPLDPAWPAWLRENRKGNRTGTQVLVPAGPGGELQLKRKGLLDSGLRLKGGRLEILENEDKVPAWSRPEIPGPGPAKVGAPPVPSASGGVDAAPAPGLAEAEALRKDLAESAMFLGNEEGQLLAGYLGLAVDVHIPIELRPDPSGRTRIGIRSRFGSSQPSARVRDGLILLNQNRHFSLLRPAAPSEPARYVSETGQLYVEVTRTVAGPAGDRTVALIPCDGHCLVSALHYLQAGALPEPGQIEHYRRHVSGLMGTEALAGLASEVRQEILAQGYLVLPDGRFPTLGPAFSRLLQEDVAFMARYEQALQAAAALASLEADGPRRPAPVPERKRDESPGYRLDIQEELRPAPPLHGIPLAWQQATIGKPRLLVINDSAAPWFLEPWEGNGSSFVLEKGGTVIPMNPRHRFRLAPKAMTVVFVDAPQGAFGFRDSVSGRVQVWAELGVQDATLAALSSGRRRAGIPPGVFLRRMEDTQSFIIQADAYPPLPASQVRGFPSMTGTTPPDVEPSGTSAHVPDGVPAGPPSEVPEEWGDFQERDGSKPSGNS